MATSSTPLISVPPNEPYANGTAYATQNSGSKSLKVIVIGAGLGGCAAAIAMHHAGFQVTVFEKVRVFGRLGDSLGLGENALRLLGRWGLFEDLVRIGNKSLTMDIRNWSDGSLLARQPLMDMAGYIGHRGDYHAAFLAHTTSLGIPIHMGCSVTSYADTAPQPSIFLADGTQHEADIIIAADGIKSLARKLVLGHDDVPIKSGYACYRAYMRVEDVPALLEDESTKELVQRDSVNIYIGGGALHLVQNVIVHSQPSDDGGKSEGVNGKEDRGTEFNWILTHADDSDIPESWTQAGDMKDVRRLISTLHSPIRDAVSMTPGCLDWKICYRRPLERWVSTTSRRIVLLGDSCHGHLPTSAQGASQAVESAAVLAKCLVHALEEDKMNKAEVGIDAVPLAALTYQKLRFARTRASQRCGEDLRDRWHSVMERLDRGEQVEPEDVMVKNRWLYTYDAEGDVEQRWAHVSGMVKQEWKRDAVDPLFVIDGTGKEICSVEGWGEDSSM